MRACSTISSMLNLSSFSLSLMNSPFFIIMVGLPVISRRTLSLFKTASENMSSTKTSEIIGIIPSSRGMLFDYIGSDAKSEIIIATTSSDG